MSDKPKLGVCYYPEHWTETRWQADAEMMAQVGISFVRIGEFAWSRLEPERNNYQFDWLERAIDLLGRHGLKVVLGTPTAAPPKWLVDEMPDMLPVGRDGRLRGFGSRRHYTFSHEGYRDECRRIVTALARRFGGHDAITAWQIDNEYDCHDTTLSFARCDLEAFRNWLATKYQSPDALNRAWGSVFWSMEINEFDEIELPNLAVTGANPSHWMDFRRFASDQVVNFNRQQYEIIRKYSQGRDIIHNFMGRTLAFDHFDVGHDLDISSWDSYPLGFLEDRSDRPDEFKTRYARTGDPDFQAFHHDLYRATSNGRWWVMEQQPGQVNWAPHNPAPHDGMVALWTLEAFAHGAETVSYFRWRQAPFAQEQMHSGLLRSNGDPAEAFHETKIVSDLIEKTDWPQQVKADVAIVFDYPSAWAWDIQPQGKEFDYFRLVYDFYKGLRQLGLSVDFVEAANPDFGERKLVLVPGLFTFNEKLISALRQFEGQVLIGPRSGSKTPDFRIPDELPPNLPADLLDITVERVESLRKDTPVTTGDGLFQFWREFVDFHEKAETIVRSDDGHPAMICQGSLHYLCGWPDDKLMAQILHSNCENAGIDTNSLPPGLRLRSIGDTTFVINYDAVEHDLGPMNLGECLHGEMVVPPFSFSVFKKS